LEEFHERFERYAAIILLFMLASSVVTYFLSSVLQRFISRPIFHLAETARTVSVEKLFRSCDQTRADELAGLLTASTKCWARFRARRRIESGQ
jgi:hypothetical protein